MSAPNPAKSQGKRVDDDKALDYLVRHATSQRLVSADARRVIAAEADRFWYMGQRLRLVGAITLSVVMACCLVGYLTWANRLQAQQRAQQEAERAEQDAGRLMLVDATQTEIDKLLKAGKLGDADLALQIAGAKGLPHDEYQKHEADIRKAKLELRKALLDSTERAIDTGRLADANYKLGEARDMGVSGPDDVRLNSIQNRLSQTEHESEFVEGRTLLADSKDAAKAGEYETAVAKLEKARHRPRDGRDFDDWEGELRQIVGARLRVFGEPKGATIKVGAETIEEGTITRGLADGTIYLAIEAPGFLPAVVRADVRFPEITEVSYNLVSQAPGPIWVSFLLREHCGQELAISYYRGAKKSQRWREAIETLVRPCHSRLKRAKPLAGDDLLKLVAKTAKKFDERSSDASAALDDLACFVIVHPETREALLEACLPQIEKTLKKLKAGCADCAGRRALVCNGCMGRGKRKEDRGCTDKDCLGGQKTHFTCRGTGKVECRVCDGKGTQNKSRDLPSNGTLQPRDKYQVPCTPCRGKGKVECKCKKGLITCTKCHGGGRITAMGPCSGCGGSGNGTPCSTCAGTGRRDQMNLARRKEIEAQLESLQRSMPQRVNN